jgi:hypothetical protein
MTNVCVTSSIRIFHDEDAIAEDISGISSQEYLQHRERAERAAAKRSPTFAGRRVHQELAQLLYEARKRIEADGKPAQ